MVAEKDHKTTEESPNGKDIYINFHLKGKTKKMFIDIRDYFNLRYNMETFRVIVKKTYDEIFKDK